MTADPVAARPPRGLFVGLATVDVVQRVEGLPGPDEKVVSSRADVSAGGPASNAAVTFAALGGDTTLLTVVGGGPLAAVVHADLAEHGVALRDVGDDAAHRPALSSVTVVDATGERSVVSRNAEGVAVDPPPDLADLVAGADVVLLDGHHPRLAVAAAAAARERGVPVVLDAGSWKPVLADLLPLVTAVICSAAFRLPDGRVPDGALLAGGPELVAVSAGAGPLRWWRPDGSGEVLVPAVRARDTLGAGDVLHGAYAFAVAAGLDLVQALGPAVAVASHRVGHVGPRSWLSDPLLPTLVPPTLIPPTLFREEPR
ncbi:PfkB family carbohydrate kinase [Cellulomonas sp. ATA003]|uniref:PfkB family carbohydrate kinase n=1 Tax=Cellulomonas sp. ATA003 TaxID=3073064 RepID=UPI002873DA87|nr:PfkB family carbohydrate kinase [Cellulomonas sp. ATA003]WNB86948.1 PfkB family carbohydrate kinase [Cellulomonas sp. ATA003]